MATQKIYGLFDFLSEALEREIQKPPNIKNRRVTLHAQIFRERLVALSHQISRQREGGIIGRYQNIPLREAEIAERRKAYLGEDPETLSQLLAEAETALLVYDALSQAQELELQYLRATVKQAQLRRVNASQNRQVAKIKKLKRCIEARNYGEKILAEIKNTKGAISAEDFEIYKKKMRHFQLSQTSLRNYFLQYSLLRSTKKLSSLN